MARVLRPHSLSLCLSLLGLFFVAAPGAFAQNDLPLTAVVTDQTPFDLSDHFGIPAASGVDQLGNFAFIGRRNSALFLRRAGSATIERLLQAGDSVPGFPGSVAQIFFGPATALGIPGKLIASGRIAFQVDFASPDGLSHRAILIYDGANYRTVVSSDDIAPDTGQPYGAVSLQALNENGDLVFATGFLSSLSGFVFPAGTVTYLVPFTEPPVRIVGTGDPSPPLPGSPPTDPGPFFSVAFWGMNDSRQILFEGRNSVENAYFLWSDGVIERVFSQPAATSLMFPPAALTASGKVIFVQPSDSSLMVYSSAAGLETVVPADSAGPAPIGGTLQPSLWATQSPALLIGLQSPPLMNEAGDILFASLVTGSPVTGLALLRRPGSGAALEVVAYAGQTAPGAGGKTFDFFTGASLAADGRVSFGALFAEGGWGVYQQTGVSAPVPLAVDHDASPLVLGGFVSLSNAPDTVAMDDGSTYFRTVNGSGDAYYGEYRGLPGALTTLMSTAQSLPPSAAVDLRLALPTVRKSFVSFIARKHGGQMGYFVRNLLTGEITRVASDGDPAPGIGGQIMSLGIPPVLNDLGQVVFLSPTSRGRSAIFRASPGEGLKKIAADGDPVLGTAFLQVSTPRVIGPPPSNSSGQVLFSALLSDFTSRLFLWNPDGTLRPVPADGDTVSDGSIIDLVGPSALLNDAGEVLFSATTAAGASGWYLWSNGVSKKVVLAGEVLPNGMTLASPSPQSLEEDGSVIFAASFTQPGLSSGTGVFLGGPDRPIETLLKTGDPAPGGGTFLSGLSGVSWTSSSTVGVGLPVGDSSSGDNWTNSGPLVGGTIHWTSGSASSTSIGVPLPIIGTSTSWWMRSNRQGDLAFSSRVGDATPVWPASGISSSGIFRRMQSGPNAGTFQAAATAGQALPGGIGQLTDLISVSSISFTSGAPGLISVLTLDAASGGFVLGPDGTIAFVNSYLQPGGTSKGAFLARVDGSLEKIIVPGDPVPGTGGTLSLIDSSLSVDNDGEMVAFAQATGGTATQAILLAQLQSGSDVTSTSLATSATPAFAAQAVQFTATVSTSTGAPTGTVNFVEDGALLGSAPLNGAGQAAFSTSALPAGNHNITAQYAGDASFAPSASPQLIQTVSLRPSSVALASSLAPAVEGQDISFTATVGSTAGGTPTGTMRFFDGSTEIGSAMLDAAGQAGLNLSSLSLGSHSLTAQYAGDFAFAASASSALAQDVVLAGFAPPPAQMTVSAGQSINIPLTLYGAPGSGLTFTLSVSGLPANSSATFSANPVSPAAPPNGTTIQLVLSTQASSTAAAPPPPAAIPSLPLLAAFACALAALTILLARSRARDRRLALSTGLATVLIAAMLVGCAGSNSTGGNFSPTPVPGTTRGPATLTVTATSNSATVTTTILVLVQ
jgi:hypothetical protein